MERSRLGQRAPLDQQEVIEKLSMWFVEAGRQSESSNATILFLLDTDGSMTYDNETGKPFVSNDLQSRLHPRIARALHAAHRISGVVIRTSSGGGASRITHVYDMSNCSFVEADCGYGTEQVERNARGEATVVPHVYSESLKTFWENASQFVDGYLRDTFNIPSEIPVVRKSAPQDYPTNLGDAKETGLVWFSSKGITTTFHERGSKIYGDLFFKALGAALGTFVGSDECKRLIEELNNDSSWGPETAVQKSDLVKALQENLVVHEANAAFELLVDLGLHKDTVADTRIAQYKPKYVLTVNDDKGDRKVMQHLRDLRDGGTIEDALLLAICYPTDELGRKTDELVRELSDAAIVGEFAPREENLGSLDEMPKTPEGQFGYIVEQAIIKARAIDPEAIPAEAVDALNTPLSELQKLNTPKILEAVATAKEQN